MRPTASLMAMLRYGSPPTRECHATPFNPEARLLVLMGNLIAVTSDDLAKYLAPGYEGRGYEFKGAWARTDPVFFARVTRAALGLSNLADGGIVIIGVNEAVNHVIDPVGMTDEDMISWNYDDV